jgi:hypothetical protein
MDLETFHSRTMNSRHNNIREILLLSIKANDTENVETVLHMNIQTTEFRIVFLSEEMLFLLRHASSVGNYKIADLLLKCKSLRVNFTQKCLFDIINLKFINTEYDIAKTLLKSPLLNDQNGELRLHLAQSLIQHVEQLLVASGQRQTFDLNIIRIVRLLSNKTSCQSYKYDTNMNYSFLPIGAHSVQSTLFFLRVMKSYTSPTPMELFQREIIKTLEAKTFSDQPLCLALCTHDVL